MDDPYELFHSDNWDALEKLEGEDKTVLSTIVGGVQDTPIHDLLRRSSPDPNEGIRRILQMHPAVAQLTTSFRHISMEDAQANYSLSTFQSLFGGPAVFDDGIYPLHQAVLNSDVTLDSCKLIVEAFPGGLLAQDDSGNTPLHYAFYFDDITEEKCRYLIDVAPSAAAIQNSYGSLALHHGAEYGSSTLETLMVLHKAHPVAIEAKNNKGKTPVQLAVAKKHPEIARMLRSVRVCSPDVPN